MVRPHFVHLYRDKNLFVPTYTFISRFLESYLSSEGQRGGPFYRGNFTDHAI